MVGTPQGLARSSSGVWWKLMGDASAAGSDASEVDRQLRGIANEEAAVRARMERRHAGAPAVRRKIAAASMGLEVVALLWYGLWRARARRRGSGSGSGRAPTTTRPSLLPALAVPAALATVALAAFGRFRNMLDRRDEQQLERLRAERKAKIGTFRGSHHNLQKLIQKYDPDDAADSNTDAAATAGGDRTKKLKTTHSRLSFHVGEEGDE
uniref:Uncharacterized protein n=1 Tax=Saccharum hybrid cultivar R570 TaxID=131158 RepID=A0A059Q2T2_9POAL|nr:hypothetical protein SHCRBa_008_B11_F_380 [Saccharum hybrid cultivar R570]